MKMSLFCRLYATFVNRKSAKDNYIRSENGGELFGKYYEGICGCGHIRIKNPTNEEFETTKKLILLLMDIINDITALEKELKK